MSELQSKQNVTTAEVPADEYLDRVLPVDFLFLDRHTCDRCAETEDALHEAIDRVADLLADLRVGIHLRKTEVTSNAAAVRTGLQISPTVRIDGRDVQPAFGASSCESCSDLAESCCDDEDEAIDCRDWLYRGRTYETPPVELLVEELLRAALGPRKRRDAGPDPTRGTENLRAFFEEDSANDEEVPESPSDDSPCC